MAKLSQMAVTMFNANGTYCDNAMTFSNGKRVVNTPIVLNKRVFIMEEINSDSCGYDAYKLDREVVLWDCAIKKSGPAPSISVRKIKRFFTLRTVEHNDVSKVVVSFSDDEFDEFIMAFLNKSKIGKRTIDSLEECCVRRNSEIKDFRRWLKTYLDKTSYVYDNSFKLTISFQPPENTFDGHWFNRNWKDSLKSEVDADSYRELTARC